MQEFGLFLDGAMVPAASGATYESINPATGAPWAVVAAAGVEDVERAVASARAAHDSGVWSRMPASERAQVLRRAADLFIERQDELVFAEVADSGGTIRKGNIADVPATMQTFQYFADLIEGYATEREEEEFVPVPSRNLIRREPVGVVAAIIPWNFPMAAAAWKVAPALAAGNAIILKPSPYTPATAVMMAQICADAGVPPGIFNVVTGPANEIGAALVAHPKVDKIAFTGSTCVGQQVMRDSAETLKRLTLELGGKSANIILDDANLDSAVRGALFGTFFHGGQVCESGTRILVQRSVFGQFVERLAVGADAIRVGDPMDMETQIGPLVSARQLENVERYVALAKEEGATLVCGGRRPEGLSEELAGGYYYRPTVFVDVRNDMRIAQEEVFGPVVVVIPFDDDEEAVAMANDSRYGLGGAVWSADTERALAIASRLETGTVWINDYHLLNPRFPFGGYKHSGFGRELGPEGLEAYLQVKHIHVGENAGPDEKYYVGMLLD